jgi:two-component system, LytTR family, response regulator
VNLPLRIVIADDERPARAFLAALVRQCPGTELVGEAADGAAAVRMIESERPDLALLDLQMPEVDGLGVVRLLKRQAIPLVAFVTAHDEYAVRAFELNAIDYLLKPVDRQRLHETLERARGRLEGDDGGDEVRPQEATRLRAAAAAYAAAQAAGSEAAPAAEYLRRIPVRQRDDILLIPVEQIASIVAHGELLHLTTVTNQRFTIAYRLRDLEMRLDPTQFIRLSRGTLANLRLLQRVSPMPGATYMVTLSTGHQLAVSRLRARALRDHLLRL